MGMYGLYNAGFLSRASIDPSLLEVFGRRDAERTCASISVKAELMKEYDGRPMKGRTFWDPGFKHVLPVELAQGLEPHWAQIVK